MNEGGEGKSVDFAGDQQPQPTTDVPQSTLPLVMQANPQTLSGMYSDVFIRVIDFGYLLFLLKLIIFII